ncbi:MAG: hydroxyethylthiazole kinase-like uncharacterized protein yjeF [Myxococcota bacterium]|jgi:hydroxyethylthiazole kinase-like uncharacterized protein yjeF
MSTSQLWPVASAEEMRALDRFTIEEIGCPGDVLMESAGRAVAERVLAKCHAAKRPSTRVIVVCGAGNNGGDGFVVARHLHQAGIDVVAVLLSAVDDLSEDAARNYHRIAKLKVATTEELDVIADGTIVVDAMFGTGLSRDIDGAAAKAVIEVNRAGANGAHVIAVDLPSGLCADTGQVLGCAVRANETVAIGLPKTGLCLEPGREHAGVISIARIGIVDETPDTKPKGFVWTREGAAAALPARPASGHKGTFGHVLLVAGARGKTGAAHLAAMGATRAGAGLVTVACPAGVSEILEIKTTEAMTVAVADTEDNSFASGSISQLLALANERDVVAVGPGVGLHDETINLTHELARRVEKPLVIDADGLNAFSSDAGEASILKARAHPTVLTPHPGEAARLLGTATHAINRDRVGAARSLARTTGSVVILKGAGTVIAAPEGYYAINPTGGPALAAGGSGDVLTGLVAAFIAQGLNVFNASVLGAWLHGAAGDVASQRRGTSGLLASEIADEVPGICADLRRQFDPSDIGADSEMEARRDERGLSFLRPFPGA